MPKDNDADGAVRSAGREAGARVAALHSAGIAQHPMSTAHKTAWTICSFFGGVECVRAGFGDADDPRTFVFLEAFVGEMYGVEAVE